MRFRKNKNILAEIILKKCIFNAVCKEVSINYAPKPCNVCLYAHLPCEGWSWESHLLLWNQQLGGMQTCKGASVNPYHSCHPEIVLFDRGFYRLTHITVAILPHPSFIPQLSRPYPKKRDYLCHDTARAMPVRYRTPLAHRAPLCK